MDTMFKSRQYDKKYSEVHLHVALAKSITRADPKEQIGRYDLCPSRMITRKWLFYVEN